ncbi:lipase secretion chaperone [Lysobacter sp. Root983]|uniref:lipase secretion chaperone n=1 Tax=Lysobacter sp. Root983 TaxID=1736613 RepID=UPI00070E7261|nr:lipase secretion chaperone [Lysobacter sp. Root983]KRD72764.1 hypothetical protein ASE43_19290 [Lysobacter sp. Root983]
MLRFTLVLMLAAGLALVLGLSGRSRETTPALTPAPPSAAANAAADARMGRPPAAAAAADDSLRGTGVDGGLTLNAAGKAVPDRAMRRLFDYFLTRLGERSPATIRDDLRRHLQPRVGAAVLAQVLAWFDAYVALERESAALGASGDLSADLQRRRELRRRRLGATVAQAWYGEDERRLEHAIARQALQRDRGLAPAQRATRLRELDAAYGLDLDATRTEGDTVALAMRQSARFEAEGAAPERRYAEREAAFGREAAQRLGELDLRRAQWNRRVAAYRVARSQVLADRGLSAAQRQARLAALLAPFDARERLRIEALTRND